MRNWYLPIAIAFILQSSSAWGQTEVVKREHSQSATSAKKPTKLMISYPGFRTSYVTIDENAKNQTVECRLYE